MLHHSVNSLQLLFPSICKILASAHPLPADLLHMLLKLYATSQKALNTTACVLFSNTLLTYWPQCSAIQNTPTCSHSGTAILQTLASSLVWAHWVTTSKRVTVPSTQSYRFSHCHSGCSSNDGLSGFSHQVNICWDILKACSASTVQVTILFRWMLK